MTAKLRRMTGIILLAVIAGLIIWDLIAGFGGGAEATISQLVLDLSRQFPVIPFAYGGVCGHLFWPQKYSLVKGEDA